MGTVCCSSKGKKVNRFLPLHQKCDEESMKNKKVYRNKKQSIEIIVNGDKNEAFTEN